MVVLGAAAIEFHPIEPEVVRRTNIASIIDFLFQELAASTSILVPPHREVAAMSGIDQPFHVRKRWRVDHGCARGIVLRPIHTFAAPLPPFVNANVSVTEGCQRLAPLHGLATEGSLANQQLDHCFHIYLVHSCTKCLLYARRRKGVHPLAQL